MIDGSRRTLQILKRRVQCLDKRTVCNNNVYDTYVVKIYVQCRCIVDVVLCCVLLHIHRYYIIVEHQHCTLYLAVIYSRIYTGMRRRKQPKKLRETVFFIVVVVVGRCVF